MSEDPRRTWTLRPAKAVVTRRGVRSRVALLAFAVLIILISVRPVSPSEQQGFEVAGAGRSAARPAAGAQPNRSPDPRARFAPPPGTRLVLDNDLGPDWN